MTSPLPARLVLYTARAQMDVADLCMRARFGVAPYVSQDGKRGELRVFGTF